MARMMWLLAPNMSSATESSLYKKSSIRNLLMLALTAILLCNAAMLAVGIVSTVTADSFTRYPKTDWHGSVSSRATAKVFYFNAIPAALLLLSTFDSVKFCTRSLRIRNIVISSCAAIVLWLIGAAVWSPCAYFERSNHGVTMPAWCPIAEGPAWPGAWKDGYKPHHFSSVYGTPPSAYYLLPWLVIAMVVINLIYLTIAYAALRLDRNLRNLASWNTKVMDEEPIELQHQPVQPVARQVSTAYSQADTVSRYDGRSTISSPSTIRATSPHRETSKRSTFASKSTRSTLPPVYDESRSTAPSVYDHMNYPHACGHCGRS